MCAWHGASRCTLRGCAASVRFCAAHGEAEFVGALEDLFRGAREAGGDVGGRYVGASEAAELFFLRGGPRMR